MDKRDDDILKFAEFVATKFQSNRDGWIYSRDTGDLKHIRYEHDYTGYNHWTQRVQRAFDLKHLIGRDSFTRQILGDRKESLRTKYLHARAWITVSLKKDSNLPDGQINGNLTHWEEDGEYIALFQPRVGVKVIEFIRANPEHPAARAILDEMHACSELSWPSSEDSTDETDEEEKGSSHE